MYSSDSDSTDSDSTDSDSSTDKNEWFRAFKDKNKWFRAFKFKEEEEDELREWYGIAVFIPTSELNIATVEGDLPKVTRLIESGESVNKKEPNSDYCPLHMAVISNKSEILDYLLAQEGVEVDARNWTGKTPLHLAVLFRRITLTEKLIKAGCDINISDYGGNTALLLSVCYPGVPCFPIQGDAENLNNSSQAAVLPEVMDRYSLEILHMLLYYNADANVGDRHNYTPFMVALAKKYVEVQEVLLEYVDDFNGFVYHLKEYRASMMYAVVYNSPFIQDMIERGFDINYGDDPIISESFCAFSICLSYPSVALSTFKFVWERLRYNDSKDTIDLLCLFGWNSLVVVPTILQVIIESDNFKVAVQCLSKRGNYDLFVDKFAERNFDLEQLTALTCRLLEHGFRPSSYDVHAIFSHYGYCELFRILLYMDIDFSRGWRPHMVLTRLMFDIDFDLNSIATQVNDIPKDALVQLLEHSISPSLVDALTLQYSEDESMSAILRSLPKVPSLIELARNPARKHIWHSFKITNNCQFYTRIDYLNIPTFYKAVLTFKRKMYVVK